MSMRENAYENKTVYEWKGRTIAINPNQSMIQFNFDSSSTDHMRSEVCIFDKLKSDNR